MCNYISAWRAAGRFNFINVRTAKAEEGSPSYDFEVTIRPKISDFNANWFYPSNACFVCLEFTFGTKT